MTEQEVLDELARRGVRLKIGGCGCCDSPWLTVELDGVNVLERDNAGIDTITKPGDQVRPS